MFDRIKKGIKGLTKKLKIKELGGKDLDPIISEFEAVLIQNEVAMRTAEDLGKSLKQELLKMEHERFKSAKPMVEEALAKAVNSILSTGINDIDILKQVEQVKSEGRPFIILMLGINGTGKTTTIAKLTRIFQKNKLSVVLAAADTFRAGSIQQLGLHADKLGVRVIAQDYNADPAAVAIDAIDHAEAKGVDVVIIDTAGRMQNNINLLRELEKIIRMTEPDLKIFVGDSLAGNDVIRQAEQFLDDVGFDGVIMTKLDGDVKGGSVLSVSHITKKPILYLGVGQGYDDLKPFDPKFIIKQILP